MIYNAPALGILAGKRFGLIAHHASVDDTGCSSPVRLRERFGDGLAALFSPEHGFFGVAGAGDHVATIRHPVWKIPVHSLYGETRRPRPEMWQGLDAVVYDLQDLSIRCYTYISTLRYVMEEAARHRKMVVVINRSNPLAGVVDGPMLHPDYESFVGCFPGPLVYGLTSGLAARWLNRYIGAELRVIPWRDRTHWVGPRWVSPSPGIRTPHTAWCYPITVGFEALPAIDYGRQTLMPFEVIGAETLNEGELAARLNAEELPGVAFHPLVYEGREKIRKGVRIAVLDVKQYRPVATAVAVLHVLQTMTGVGKLWRRRGSRAGFFDQLFGTDHVRRSLMSGISWRKIADGWSRDLDRWRTGAF